MKNPIRKFLLSLGIILGGGVSSFSETYVYIDTTSADNTTSKGTHTAWNAGYWYNASDVMTDGVVDSAKLAQAKKVSIAKPTATDSAIITGYEGAYKSTAIEDNPYTNADGGHIWALYSWNHNAGASVEVENLTYDIAKSYVFNDSANEYRFGTDNSGISNIAGNSMKVNGTFTVKGGNIYHILGGANTYNSEGGLATYKNWYLIDINKLDLSTTDTASNAHATLKFSNYIRELRIGVSEASGVYSLKSDVVNSVATNSTLQIGGANAGELGNFYLGNFNNSGTINLIDSSSKFNFLGTITNSDTGLLQITGGIVKDLKTTGGVVKMTSGTFAGNISIKSEFETSNSTGVTITQLADSVINVETNRFWINYTTTDGGTAKYSGFESHDVNLNGIINIQGNATQWGEFSNTRNIPNVFITGKNVTINEINFKGNTFWETNVGIDHQQRIGAGQILKINELTVQGSTKEYSSYNQYLYLVGAGSGLASDTVVIDVGTLNISGGETSEDMRGYTNVRLNAYKKNAKIGTVNLNGYYSSRSSLNSHGTNRLDITNFNAENTFLFDHEYNAGVADFFGTNLYITNFNVAIKDSVTTTHNSEILAKSLNVTNATFKNVSSSHKLLYAKVFETVNFENITIGSNDSTNRMELNIDTVTYSKNSAGTNTGDDRGAVNYGTLTINSNGWLNSGGNISGNNLYNTTIGTLNLNGTGAIQLGLRMNGGSSTAPLTYNFASKIDRISGEGELITWANAYNTNNHTITVGNSSDTSASIFVGTIREGSSNGNIYSTTSIIKEGSNIQVLGGANSFRGDVTVSGGTLLLSHDDVVSKVTINGGNFGFYNGSLNVNEIEYVSGTIFTDVNNGTYNGFIMEDSTALKGNITADSFSYSNIVENQDILLFVFMDGLNNSALQTLLDGTYEYTDKATGLNYIADYNFDAMNGNSYTVSFTAIPEPATYAVILGILALGFAYRRRK